MNTQDVLDRIQAEFEALGLTYSENEPRSAAARHIFLQDYTIADATWTVGGTLLHTLTATYIARSQRMPYRAFGMPPVYEEALQFQVSSMSYLRISGVHEETVTVVAYYI